MTRQPPITSDEIDAYLDDRLDPAARSEFETRLAQDSAAQQQLNEARQLNEHLRAQFGPPQITVDDVEQWLASATPAKVDPWRRVVLVVSALAAVALIGFALWFAADNDPPQPFFEPRPLAAIFDETVANGFRPYYFCEDPQRFAGTFQKRQGTSLRLADTPDDREMIGLSYLGGLTRDTTAMLCRVDDQPVIVFVDRADAASQAVTTPQADLFVHTATLGDLVLFEVGPFEAPQMMEYLELAGRP